MEKDGDTGMKEKKELDKKKELERYKPKEQENLWKKHLKNQSRDKDGMEL